MFNFNNDVSTFKKIVEKINNYDDSDIPNIMSKFYIHGNTNLDELLKVSKNLHIGKVPYVLHELYKSNDDNKFELFCNMLNATYKFLPFLTNLEQYNISDYHFSLLVQILPKIFSECHNGIGDCMGLIYLYREHKPTLLGELKTTFINGLNDKLKRIRQYLTYNKDGDDSTFSTLEILFDLSCEMYDNDTIQLIKDFKTVEFSNIAKIFYIKSCLTHNLDIPEYFYEDIYNDLSAYHRLVSILTGMKKTDVIPPDYIDKERLARSGMVVWLTHPLELDQAPDTIEYVDTMERDNLVYYIYKFTSKKYSDRGEMIGISGAYAKDSFDTYLDNFTISQYETISDDYLMQAIRLQSFLEEKWQEVTKNNVNRDCCIVSDRITKDGFKVGYMYREEPDEGRPDSGWRFTAGNEDEEYMTNPNNHHIYKISTICEYDPDIIPYLNSNVGSVLIRINEKEFELDKKDKPIYIMKQDK